MITHTHIEFLDAGSIPIYDFGDHLFEPGVAYQLSEVSHIVRGSWHPRLIIQRFLVSTGIDMPLDDFEERMRDLLEELGDQNGSLLFTLQYAYNLDGLGSWVMGGLVFLPFAFGTPLAEGTDVPSLLKATCDMWLVGGHREMHDATHAAALRFHDPANPRHEWPQGEVMTEEAITDAIRRSHENRRAKERRVARAKTLLVECLPPHQREEFETFGEFHITGDDGYTYIICEGYGHNVFRVEGGERTVEYCLIMESHAPIFDLMLGQKLLLERDPNKFFEKANAWWLH